MAGTAFVSEYFEKRAPGTGRMEHAEPAPAFGTQATPPAMYQQGQSSKGRGTIIVSVVLRLLTFLFALIAVAILASSKGRYGIQAEDGSVQVQTVKFTVLRAFKYLFSACCIVAVYSLAVMTLSLISLCVRALANSKIILWIIFTCDQVLAYLLISAGAAGANGVMVSNKDENITGFTGLLSCTNLGLGDFCNKAAASVGLAFAAFLFLAITSVLSSRRLFRH
ncbi:hypothetical protein KC19_7G063000 [Ceratodon purpureus]|uniref:CASP-like protein n=1 Tax=Ceratodon purpureus TaxID=3225 RepID=A0A8T0H6U9_CERPU|nr:hypothetical protein KC19_7G063000 [Ceratodon purpureus]